MEMFNASILIRETRKIRGFTQERLAEGICSRHTITKIENGERKPDWFTFKSLMLRLGIDIEENRYSDFDSEEVIEHSLKLNKAREFVVAFDWEGQKKIIDELEQDKKFTAHLKKNKSNRSRFLQLKGAFYLSNTDKYRDIKRAIECITEALKIFRPGFSLDNLNDYFLTYNELLMLNSLAGAYHYSRDFDKSIEMYTRILANLDNNFSSAPGEFRNKFYVAVFCNLSKSYEEAGRWEEALTCAEKGLVLAKNYRDMLQYSKFLGVNSRSLLELGRKEEGDIAYKNFLLYSYVLDGVGDISFKEHKDVYKNRYGEFLDLSIEW